MNRREVICEIRWLLRKRARPAREPRSVRYVAAMGKGPVPARVHWAWSRSRRRSRTPSVAEGARGEGNARGPTSLHLAVASRFCESADGRFVVRLRCNRLVGGPDLLAALFAAMEKMAHDLPILGGRGLRIGEATERFLTRVFHQPFLSRAQLAIRSARPTLERNAETEDEMLSSRTPGSITIMERESKRPRAE